MATFCVGFSGGSITASYTGFEATLSMGTGGVVSGASIAMAFTNVDVDLMFEKFLSLSFGCSCQVQ